jgi:hypothetical protein
MRPAAIVVLYSPPRFYSLILVCPGKWQCSRGYRRHNDLLESGARSVLFDDKKWKPRSFRPKRAPSATVVRVFVASSSRSRGSCSWIIRTQGEMT